MKGIIHKKPTFWKYETTASYVVLCCQYLYILVFGKNIDKEVAKQYVDLWFYDLMIFFPVIFLLFFPQKFRIIFLSLIFCSGLFYFYDGLGFNSIVLNTFLSFFLRISISYLIFPTWKEESYLSFVFLRFYFSSRLF